MVAPVQVRGSDDGVRPDELNSTHPRSGRGSEDGGSCGSHLDSGERSKVPVNVYLAQSAKRERGSRGP
ncbi:hypothetical protein Tco_1023749 [Tanacetum coccineum]